MYIKDYLNPTLKYLDRYKHKKLLKDANQISHMQVSVKSEFIECSYQLKIYVEYHNMLICGSKKLSVELPINISIPEIKTYLVDSIPEDWKPNIMPDNEINLPSAEELGIQHLIKN